MPNKPLIAIVDDDVSVRNALQDLLRSAGFSTTLFQDAASFLASAVRASVDCLVADMRMPGMTGLELYHVLGASGVGIPTVILTGHPEKQARAHSHEAGVTCYLSKPFEPDQLLECVRKAVAKSRSGRTIPRS